MRQLERPLCDLETDVHRAKRECLLWADSGHWRSDQPNDRFGSLADIPHSFAKYPLVREWRSLRPGVDAHSAIPTGPALIYGLNPETALSSPESGVGGLYRHPGAKRTFRITSVNVR